MVSEFVPKFLAYVKCQKLPSIYWLLHNRHFWNVPKPSRYPLLSLYYTMYIFRYLRDKISQQKIQISTITKGVPMTKIEVRQKLYFLVSKRRRVVMLILILRLPNRQHTLASSFRIFLFLFENQNSKIFLHRCEKRSEAVHGPRTESLLKSIESNLWKAVNPEMLTYTANYFEFFPRNLGWECHFPHLW